MRKLAIHPLRCLLLLFCCLPIAHAATPNMQIGFDGHFKAESWFPVVLDSVPDAVSVTLRMIETGYGMGGQQRTVAAVYAAEQDPVSGTWHALLYAPRSHRDNILQAVISLADGTDRILETSLKGVDAGTTLVLVVTDAPDDFAFLRMLEHGSRRVTLVVAQDASLMWNRDWRDLSGVDVVVLDGPEPLAAEDAQALRQWTQRGGSVILTDRVWASAEGTWGMASVGVVPDMLQADGAVLAGLLQNLDTLDFVRRFPMTVDGFVPVYGDAVGMLVGSRDRGMGRVIALGFDWRSVALRDRALLDTVRRDIWSALLDLMRAAADAPHIRSTEVIPREAQVKTLMWPILGFLLLCAIGLGPVNWFVLRRMRKGELSVVTLPVGAVVLSAVALLAGLLWHPSHVIVEELYVSTGDAELMHGTHGVSGVFSPRSTAYDMMISRPATLLREAGLHSWRSWGSESITADTLYRTGKDASGIDGVAIGRWSMHFLQATEAGEGAASLVAHARVVSEDRLEGTVGNRSDGVIEHVNVVFGQFRVSVGSLAPGEEQSFGLDMKESDIILGERCSGCGGYHDGGDPFVTRKREEPLPRHLAGMGHAASGWARGGLPVPAVVGIQDMGKPFVDVYPSQDGDPIAWASRFVGSEEGSLSRLLPERVEYRSVRLLAVAVQVAWHESAYVPNGFTYMISLPRITPETDLRSQDSIWQRNMRRAPAHYQPVVLALQSAFRAQPELQGATDPDGRPLAANLPIRADAYILPGDVRGRVVLDWDFSEAEDEGEGAYDVILEVYNWRVSGWHEVARGRAGSHRISFERDSDFFMQPHPAVILRQRVVSDDMQEAEPLHLHSHSMRFPGLHRTSINMRVVPEGASDE